MLNQSIVRHLLHTGQASLSSTRVQARWALRLCPMNYRTRDADVLQIVDAVERTGRELLAQRWPR